MQDERRRQAAASGEVVISDKPNRSPSFDGRHSVGRYDALEIVMSPELVNTFGTLLTVAIIAATAIAAMVQLRHLRAGNQINAMLSIGH